MNEPKSNFHKDVSSEIDSYQFRLNAARSKLLTSFRGLIEEAKVSFVQHAKREILKLELNVITLYIE